MAGQNEGAATGNTNDDYEAITAGFSGVRASETGSGASGGGRGNPQERGTAIFGPELTPERQELIDSILAAQSKLAELDASIADQVSGGSDGARRVPGAAGTGGNGDTAYQTPPNRF